MLELPFFIVNDTYNFVNIIFPINGSPYSIPFIYIKKSLSYIIFEIFFFLFYNLNHKILSLFLLFSYPFIIVTRNHVKPHISFSSLGESER